MMQKRVVTEYCSMILRSADYASIVLESASSRKQICRGATFVRPSGCLAIFLCANFLTFSRTTKIPRSSDAFNSITLCLKKSCPKSSFAKARIVEILLVPGVHRTSNAGLILWLHSASTLRLPQSDERPHQPWKDDILQPREWIWAFAQRG
jgi:hypothetical protein